MPLSPEAYTAISNATNPLYDKEKWGEARVGMCQLSDSRPDDFMISLKAAVCVALSDKDFKVRCLSAAHTHTHTHPPSPNPTHPCHRALTPCPLG